MEETRLLERITVNPQIFGGKPIVRGRRLAVEHVLEMLAAGDTPETILEGYPWLERAESVTPPAQNRRGPASGEMNRESGLPRIHDSNLGMSKIPGVP